jgi:formamidopyrimidine-DNA glycosylase
MPEGPEVKLSADLIRPIIKGSHVTSIIPSITGRYKNLAPEGLTEFTRSLSDVKVTIDYINTKGKFMYWSFSNNWHMFCTFGMSGQWSPNMGKHPCLHINYEELVSSEKKTIFFNDPRHFGTIKFTNSERELSEKLNELGWDPLHDMYRYLNYEFWLKSKIENSNKPIGQLLMDQTVFAGVGNYIRAEALYAAKISPWRVAKTMVAQDIDTLGNCIEMIMRDSYKQQGATIKTYKTAYGAEGKYSSCFKVYGKKIDPLGNAIIKEETPDGRTIHWCPALQT